jgi:predicted SnoaL-like aldol condensation-catalyzing enzyme
MAMPSTTSISNKDAAVAFLELASAGKVREAFDRYVAPSFRHHNAYFKSDAESLAAAMAQNAAENPEKVYEAKHVLQDGNLVAVHGRVRLKPNEPDYALFHLFKFENGRVVELWDIAQAAPADSPNELGLF